MPALKLAQCVFWFCPFHCDCGVCELVRMVYTYDEFIDMVWAMAVNPRFDVLRAGLHGSSCFRFSAGTRH